MIFAWDGQQSAGDGRDCAAVVCGPLVHAAAVATPNTGEWIKVAAITSRRERQAQHCGFIEPLEEVNYSDPLSLVAVDHRKS